MLGLDGKCEPEISYRSVPYSQHLNRLRCHAGSKSTKMTHSSENLLISPHVATEHAYVGQTSIQRTATGSPIPVHLILNQYAEQQINHRTRNDKRCNRFSNRAGDWSCQMNCRKSFMPKAATLIKAIARLWVYVEASMARNDETVKIEQKATAGRSSEK